MENKTVIGKLLEKIGDFFEGIFKASKDTYDKVSPEVQEALIKGSEIIKLVNDNLDKAPDFVYELLESKFPEITKEKLQEILAKAADALNVVDDIHDLDMVQTIGNIQYALENSKTKDGTVWAAISSTAAKLIAVFLAPKGTKWATIETLMEYVYRTFIKK